jgi:hypothetical protein
MSDNGMKHFDGTRVLTEMSRQAAVVIAVTGQAHRRCNASSRRNPDGHRIL